MVLKLVLFVFLHEGSWPLCKCSTEHTLSTVYITMKYLLVNFDYGYMTTKKGYF